MSASGRKEKNRFSCSSILSGNKEIIVKLEMIISNFDMPLQKKLFYDNLLS